MGALRSEPSALEKGRLFEQWVVQEMQRLNLYKIKDWRFSFWRTSHGAEVDVVVERGRKMLFAVECKFKHHLSRSDLSGIGFFREVHSQTPCYIAAPIAAPQKIDDVLALPPSELLKVIRQY